MKQGSVRHKAVMVALGISLGLPACTGTVTVAGSEESGIGAAAGERFALRIDVNPDRPCAELAHDVKAVLTKYCASCHANGGGQGGFSEVLNVPAMIQRALIVPNNPPASRVFALVDSGVMPRTVVKPSRAEIDLLGAWIGCGASDWNAQPVAPHFAPLSVDERLAGVRADLAKQAEEAREHLRYVDFSPLGSAIGKPEELEAYRGVISLLVNSLSTGREVVAPQPVGRDALLARIDLRDYGWDSDTWNSITAAYPYGVLYEQESREELARDIREQTGAQIPVVQADWLLNHASRPPLYYDILQIPEDVTELARSLGVDVAEAVEEGEVVRAGFNGSGVSSNNRVIERHALPERDAALWLSYDFRDSVEDRNIFANPLDFEQDGGEGIFNLDNGLQAYFLVNAEFERLDKAPTDIVADPSTRDGAVEAGVSCMGGCHLTRGIIEKDDQVRDAVENSGRSDETVEGTQRLYLPPSQMRPIMDRDAERYRAAVAATGFVLGDETAVIRRARAQEGLLDGAAVAAVLGVPADALQRALAGRPEDFPRELRPLARPHGTIYRSVLEDQFEALVSGLGLGEQLDADDNEEDDVEGESDAEQDDQDAAESDFDSSAEDSGDSEHG